jgi:hypothetical protein
MRTPIAFFLAACMAAANSPAMARAHEHAATPAKAATATRAARFATDATLRREMQGVRAAVAAMDHYEHGHLGPDKAVILATQIEDRVRTIIANCKLPPAADAALHTIIVPLMQSAGRLRNNAGDLSALASMRKSIADYDRQFQGP